MGVKGVKRSLKIWTTNLFKSIFKNILLYMNGWLSKIRTLLENFFSPLWTSLWLLHGLQGLQGFESIWPPCEKSYAHLFFNMLRLTSTFRTLRRYHYLSLGLEENDSVTWWIWFAQILIQCTVVRRDKKTYFVVLLYILYCRKIRPATLRTKTIAKVRNLAPF